MYTLNLGILAHVDAGKTTLTERLLYAAGVIDEPGSVDAGTTQTDTLALERRRGITIKAAVVSFVVDGVTVNLLDTPGHPDFIAEVERALGVLDGAVLVISAVEGVQAQTRILMRALQRLQVPTLLFVNKIDRRGARDAAVLDAIAGKLTADIVPMGTVHDLGTRHAGFTPHPGPPAPDTLSRTRQARLHPVFFGSAITGAGVEPLRHALAELLPACTGNAGAPISGVVFKVERGRARERIAYVRMYAGTVHVRDRVEVRPAGGEPRRVTAIRVFENGTDVPSRDVTAGHIAKLWGLGDVRIGDVIGQPPRNAAATAGAHHFAPPTLETVVVPRRAEQKGALRTALDLLAEQDPLIDVRQDDVRQELRLSLYGEVQKEVIEETLAADFGVAVDFRETTTICIERPVGTGAAVEVMHTPSNPILATVGLRVDPAPPGSGIAFRLEVEYGSIPHAFHRAVEDTVHEALREGLYGWQVTDCIVTMTHSGYAPRQSHAHQRFSRAMSSTGADFRNLTPLVLMTALAEAGTMVFEPVHRFRLDLPADALGPVLPVLTRFDAVPQTPQIHGQGQCTIEGHVPAARIHALQQRLPALTSGEGVLECTFDGYQPVRGPLPSRPRTDDNPLDRKEYLLRVLGRPMR